MIHKVINSEFLDAMYAGNLIAEYLRALGVFVVAIIVLFIVQKIVIKRCEGFAQRTETKVDDLIIAFIGSIRPRLYIVLSFFLAMQSLHLSSFVQHVISAAVIVLVIFQVTRSLQIVIEYIAQRVSGEGDDMHTKSATYLLSTIMTVIVWIFGVLMILSNIGVNVSSLIAGVGIGGVAIAFAVKEVLADLFSSFAIYFDKPFKAGDVIRVGTDTGEVKKIGIKTTRVKSTSGEEIIISNQELTSSRVHNFKKMDHRNVTTHFGVGYDTTNQQITEIIAKVREMIDAIDQVHCKRVHFKSFGEWALEFEVVYVVETRKYSVYMDIQQQINMGIKDILEKMDIALSHRTS